LNAVMTIVVSSGGAGAGSKSSEKALAGDISTNATISRMLKTDDLKESRDCFCRKIIVLFPPATE